MMEKEIRGWFLFCRESKLRKPGGLTNIHNRVKYGFHARASIARQTLRRITNKGDGHVYQEKKGQHLFEQIPLPEGASVP
jgi:hypothetical protein